jgi:hypothetical protein
MRRETFVEVRKDAQNSIIYIKVKLADTLEAVANIEGLGQWQLNTLHRSSSPWLTIALQPQRSVYPLGSRRQPTCCT